jgi:NHS family xanthosine MFS transporter
MKDWHTIWFGLCDLRFVIAIAFAILFKHKHNQVVAAAVSHH